MELKCPRCKSTNVRMGQGGYRCNACQGSFSPEPNARFQWLPDEWRATAPSNMSYTAWLEHEVRRLRGEDAPTLVTIPLGHFSESEMKKLDTNPLIALYLDMRNHPDDREKRLAYFEALAAACRDDAEAFLDKLNTLRSVARRVIEDCEAARVEPFSLQKLREQAGS